MHNSKHPVNGHPASTVLEPHPREDATFGSEGGGGEARAVPTPGSGALTSAPQRAGFGVWLLAVAIVLMLVAVTWWAVAVLYAPRPAETNPTPSRSAPAPQASVPTT